jgi:hypothetical protein
MRAKKVAIIILAVLGAYLLFGVVQGAYRGFMEAKRHGGSPALRERRLVELSKAMNQGLPKQAGEETILEKTTAGPGLRFTYIYKFANRSAAEVDPAKLTALVKSKIGNRYKTAPEMADFRKWEVELHYEYCDKDGNEITKVVFSPNDL